MVADSWNEFSGSPSSQHIYDLSFRVRREAYVNGTIVAVKVYSIKGHVTGYPGDHVGHILIVDNKIDGSSKPFANVLIF